MWIINIIKCLRHTSTKENKKTTKEKLDVYKWKELWIRSMIFRYFYINTAKTKLNRVFHMLYDKKFIVM